MEAQKKKADAVLKAEAIRIEKERKQAIKQGYTNAQILKRKCDKNRDALIVLAPWFPVLRFLCCDSLMSRCVI